MSSQVEQMQAEVSRITSGDEPLAVSAPGCRSSDRLVPIFQDFSRC